jgi:hypothetical protein
MIVKPLVAATSMVSLPRSAAKPREVGRVGRTKNDAQHRSKWRSGWGRNARCRMCGTTPHPSRLFASLSTAPPSTPRRRGREGKKSRAFDSYSAASGVINAGGLRFGAVPSSAIIASRSRASWASRCRFHMLA